MPAAGADCDIRLVLVRAVIQSTAARDTVDFPDPCSFAWRRGHTVCLALSASKDHQPGIVPWYSSAATSLWVRVGRYGWWLCRRSASAFYCRSTIPHPFMLIPTLIQECCSRTWSFVISVVPSEKYEYLRRRGTWCRGTCSRTIKSRASPINNHHPSLFMTARAGRQKHNYFFPTARMALLERRLLSVVKAETPISMQNQRDELFAWLKRRTYPGVLQLLRRAKPTGRLALSELVWLCLEQLLPAETCKPSGGCHPTNLSHEATRIAGEKSLVVQGWPCEIEAVLGRLGWLVVTIYVSDLYYTSPRTFKECARLATSLQCLSEP